MALVEVFLIGVGLSMDAFAVSVCKGLNMRRLNLRHALVIGLFFGGFQAVMPLIGWILGKQFESYITSFDHWIAFILLGFIGGKMIYETVKELRSGEDECEVCRDVSQKLDLKELTVLAVATSIDALAVGITLAFMSVNIFAAIAIIGVTTFLLSIVGVWLGNRFGAKYKAKAELAGGVILVLIGIKILLEHLGLLPF